MKLKKGVSPVIATVLLIAIVVVIALIIFLWFRGINQETITKFGGKNIELVCQEVEFEADYSRPDFYISNLGNVPIFSFNVKVLGDGSHQTNEMTELVGEEWPEVGLNQGGTFFTTLDLGDPEKIILTPILRGNSDAGEKNYECSELQHSYEIILS